MAALVAGRNTQARSGSTRELPVKANAKIYAGAMVAVDAAGYAVPAATSTTLKVVGRADALADNAGGVDGAIKVKVSCGIFRFANSSAGDLIALADVNGTCYAVDDQTVAKTNGTNTRSAAGIIFDVDAQGVWVRIV
ncbi:hypothetical protein RA307_31100 [Xanthobacteraceae bacterium Astr-EGSB]|uniref:hypothetical protein n=1 Tax=Astrobacterium formosum TaxID=3069710 RepID=UPI0027AFBD72|nr:hypothetical protein [Xanthobacteraceae bacterium Astr-EGSB]